MRPIEIPDFSFNSPLANVVIELERLRGDLGTSTTPSEVFGQLKQLFQLMTSIMSARIEGNRTSILEIVEGAQENTARDRSVRSAAPDFSDGVKEIILLEEASKFIDEHIHAGTTISHALVRELHRIAVSGLEREGDRTPGSYRTTDVVIQGSDHRPPPFASIQADMQELLDFINQEMDRKFDLLKVAIAHHRFVWIHPFGNGNGRTCRLLTYAIMVSQGFTATTDYRAVDPTAVFGADRESYYRHLEAADSLEPATTIQWCTYLLGGMLKDLRKLNKLGNHDFVVDELLVPSLERARQAGIISLEEFEALKIFAVRTTVKATDLSNVVLGSSVVRSQFIRRLINRRLVEPITEGKRSYRLVMAPGPLTPFILRQLDKLEFLPQILRDDA